MVLLTDVDYELQDLVQTGSQVSYSVLCRSSRSGLQTSTETKTGAKTLEHVSQDDTEWTTEVWVTCSCSCLCLDLDWVLALTWCLSSSGPGSDSGSFWDLNSSQFGLLHLLHLIVVFRIESGAGVNPRSHQVRAGLQPSTTGWNINNHSHLWSV